MGGGAGGPGGQLGCPHTHRRSSWAAVHVGGLRAAHRGGCECTPGFHCPASSAIHSGPATRPSPAALSLSDTGQGLP